LVPPYPDTPPTKKQKEKLNLKIKLIKTNHHQLIDSPSTLKFTDTKKLDLSPIPLPAVPPTSTPSECPARGCFPWALVSRLRTSVTGSASRIGKFSRLIVVHGYCGPAVLLLMLPTPPHGDAVCAGLPPETALPVSGTFTRVSPSSTAHD